MNKIKLGIIYGGVSSEHEVSINSFRGIISNIDKDKYDISEIYIDKKGDWYGDNLKIADIFTYLRNLDVVFPILHGTYGEDGCISGLLNLVGVPYVGCDLLSSSLCMDKVYTNIMFNNANLNHAKYIYIKNINDKYIYLDDEFNEKELDIIDICNMVKNRLCFPVFVKPSRSGSSVGINKAYNIEELKEYIDYAKRFDNKILIEENIDGREVECAILGNNDLIVSTVGEIISSSDYYSYDAKYLDNNSKVIVPAELDNDIIDKIKYMANKAYKLLDCKGLSRIDFFIENNTNEIYINEINTMPGFTEISMYPKLIEEEGIVYSELLDRLINLAMNK